MVILECKYWISINSNFSNRYSLWFRNNRIFHEGGYSIFVQSLQNTKDKILDPAQGKTIIKESIDKANTSVGDAAEESGKKLGLSQLAFDSEIMHSYDVIGQKVTT